ncbi:small integral membrane protein 4 [Diprion similis]|uniref:small integral membrane protein 4 n=1 Tax=Diprion similis TaxID=362088 RepID=UPI001EF90798|nr:small integral membrane protein 4 [Diprion similis]
MLLKRARRSLIGTVFDKWPGKKLFGVYRFLPIFFVLGAALEFSMINWHVGEVNFYKTFKKRRIEEAVEKKLAQLQT